MVPVGYVRRLDAVEGPPHGEHGDGILHGPDAMLHTVGCDKLDVGLTPASGRYGGGEGTHESPCLRAPFTHTHPGS